MPDYSKGKIYCIRSPHTDEVYIGSTIQPLSKRLGEHRKQFRWWKKGEYRFVSSFKVIEHGDEYIELIEEYSCESKEQLQRREGEITRETHNHINKNIAGRTKMEYYEENKGKILQKYKEYYEENKDEILQKNKEYREENKDKISEQRKKYRKENKDKISQRNKKYREENKDKIKDKRNNSI